MALRHSALKGETWRRNQELNCDVGKAQVVREQLRLGEVGKDFQRRGHSSLVLRHVGGSRWMGERRHSRVQMCPGGGEGV